MMTRSTTRSSAAPFRTALPRSPLFLPALVLPALVLPARLRPTVLRPALLAALFLLGGALAGCASQPRSASADLESIASFNERYLRAINEGDAATLASLTTKDHLMMIPNQPVIAGKEKHDAANKRAAETFRIDETWTPVETVVDRDLAYQRGTYTVKATPRTGGEARTSEGKFLRIYRRQPDGSWAMTIDSFSSDTPPKPNPN